MENGLKQVGGAAKFLPKFLLTGKLGKILNVATVQTKASEELAESIVDEATAVSAELGEAYTAGGTAVDEYINEGVTWADWRIG